MQGLAGQRGMSSTQVIETNIVLIPRVENPTSMKDLRPISLCNVIHKIISKVLANRMKEVLAKCTSLEQYCDWIHC